MAFLQTTELLNEVDLIRIPVAQFQGDILVFIHLPRVEFISTSLQILIVL